jgi:hypothetical protein
MDLDAGNHCIERCRLGVEQADRRGADQHQMPCDHAGLHRAIEHVGCRDIDAGIALGEMHPDPSFAVGGNLQTLDRNALDAGAVGFDQDRVGAGDGAQHLEAQRRHDYALRLHHHGHAAHETVALLTDREQAASHGGLFQQVDIPDQSGKRQHERLRIAAEHGQSRQGQRLVEFRNDIGQAGLAKHHAPAPDGVGQHLIVAG